jgi:hypothetical protein
MKLLQNPRKYVCLLALGLLSSAAATTINFDSLNATAGSVTGAPLNTYLAGFGVTLINVTSGTQMVVQDENVIYGGNVVDAPSSRNVLGQQGTAGAASFTLSFASVVSNLSFDRVGIYGNINPTSFPTWSATALDVNGNSLGAYGEVVQGYWHYLAPTTFTFAVANIKSVRFDGNAHNYAAFTNVLIDNITYTPSAGSVPDSSATLPLLAGALALLGTWARRRTA